MAAAARLNVFADAVVAAIVAGLTAGDNTEVRRSFHPDVLDPDYDPRGIETRRAYVVPVTRMQVENATRGEDLFEYAFAVLTVSRFTGAAGDPPDDWIDAEMAWQETYVDDRLSDDRTANTPAALLSTAAYCARSEPIYQYEPDALQSQRLFYSLQNFAYRRAE